MRMIDADALKNKLYTDSDDHADRYTWHEVYEMNARVIDQMPTIYPVEHVTGGSWIEDKYTRRCSNCGRTYWQRGGESCRYCPECGSRNEEENATN